MALSAMNIAKQEAIRRSIVDEGERRRHDEESRRIALPRTDFGEQAFRVTDDYGGLSLGPIGPQHVSQPKPVVAPVLPETKPPFAKSERKRALVNANYYSECFMNAIPTKDAVTAADYAKEWYEKWWVKSKYATDEETTSKKARLSTEIGAEVSSSASSVRDLPMPSEDEATVISRQSFGGRALHDVAEAAVIRSITCVDTSSAHSAKTTILEDLRKTGGDTTGSRFLSCLDVLHASYVGRGYDARWLKDVCTSPYSTDGTWLTLSKPTFTECLGRNEKGQYLYSLGRMSFDMFRPTNLRCSIQGIFNRINLVEDDPQRPRTFPRRLQRSYESSAPDVRNYDIVSAFTIEANQTRRGEPADKAAKGDFVVRRPIRCLLTNHGYCVPDPDEPNRLSIWFSGGTLAPQDSDSLADWQQLFDESQLPRRDVKEFARVLAAKFLLGAHSDSVAEDCSKRYRLNRPIGGHGQVFCDVLYSDENLRIVRGHHGSIFVFTRVPTGSSD